MLNDGAVEELAQAMRDGVATYKASYDPKTARHTLDPHQAAAAGGVNQPLQDLIAVIIESRLQDFTSLADNVEN